MRHLQQTSGHRLQPWQVILIVHNDAFKVKSLFTQVGVIISWKSYTSDPVIAMAS